MQELKVVGLLLLAAVESAAQEHPCAPSSPKPIFGLCPRKVVRAIYPEEAVRSGLQGDVTVAVAVSDAGDVTDTKALSGDPVLTKSALDAVRLWKFRQCRLVESAARTSWTLRFVLGPDGKPVYNQYVRPVPVVMPEVLIRRVSAKYPDVHSLSPREQDSLPAVEQVAVRFVITKDGSVGNVRPVSGRELFYDSAVEAVKQWRYRPRFVDGEPVELEMESNVEFRRPVSITITVP